MKLHQCISCFALFIILVGCGGGSLSDDGGGGEETPDDEITISLVISNEMVSEQSPATITATVKQGNTLLAGKLVTFTLDNADLAFFNPEIGTANTQSNGEATIILNAGETAGAGQVTATVEEVDPANISFTSQGDGNTGGLPDLADISLFASSQQIASSGAQSITLTAIAKDTNNNLLDNVNVTFTADSGQVEVLNALTGADGQATATLKTDNEPTNRVITTTASSNFISDTVSVQVVGTTVSLTGSSSLAINDDNSYIIKVLDSDGNGISNTQVNLSLTNVSTETPAGAVASLTLADSVTTDFTGQTTVVVTGTSGGTNTIVASALGASVSQEVAVQSDSFLFTGFDNGNGTNVDPSDVPAVTIPDVLLSDTATLSLTWLRSGVAVADGTQVNFTTTRGSLATTSATTNNGLVTATLTADNAGKALVTFTGTDGDIILNNQLEFEFIAETVDTIVAQALPKSVGPSGQTSTISVVVKDANGNLVKNKDIDFTLTDTNGGTIFPASAVTDSNGSASTIYTSNTVSAQDGVSVQASVRDDPTKTDTVTLTVADRELFIAVGTGNDVIEHDSTSYNKQYSVFVTDVDSNPVANVNLTVSAIPNNFYKGRWWARYDGDEFLFWEAGGQEEFADPNVKFECANEDLNLDGILDPGEDTNGNGFLTPGNVVAAQGEVTTDSQGSALIDILYPQSFAQWVDIRLILSTQVNGTESATQTIFTLPVLASDVLNEDIPPPTSSVGLESPFGRMADCTNID
ncbi:Ig-like domain-containing protein [Thalassomonas viridans]|uniref:Ig-like domain-containing protein n=1 Tax=Thalassomonas viridans TaxID=137584 RepID=A0AAE9YZZ5_9GAMM|nr:Ig-like domain-containing protein [Thalassomonas viridans]WDE03514.1 Ig-like domain-containing protein [Thalassomonas viridans]